MAEIALGVAGSLGLSGEEVRDLRRAALLHDLGKLGVSNRILDKPAALTPDERAAMNLHPALTARILGRIPAFGELARVAAAHHEKLDGSGYHLGLRAEEISVPSRILVVSDIFEALTAERPYRAPLAAEQALELMRADVGTKLCGDAYAALASALGGAPSLLAAA